MERERSPVVELPGELRHHRRHHVAELAVELELADVELLDPQREAAVVGHQHPAPLELHRGAPELEPHVAHRHHAVVEGEQPPGVLHPHVDHPAGVEPRLGRPLQLQLDAGLLLGADHQVIAVGLARLDQDPRVHRARTARPQGRPGLLPGGGQRRPELLVERQVVGRELDLDLEQVAPHRVAADLGDLAVAGDRRRAVLAPDVVEGPEVGVDLQPTRHVVDRVGEPRPLHPAPLVEVEHRVERHLPLLRAPGGRPRDTPELGHAPDRTARLELGDHLQDVGGQRVEERLVDRQRLGPELELDDRLRAGPVDRPPGRDRLAPDERPHLLERDPVVLEDQPAPGRVPAGR